MLLGKFDISAFSHLLHLHRPAPPPAFHLNGGAGHNVGADGEEGEQEQDLVASRVLHQGT